MKVYNLKSFAIVLDKIVFVSAVFKADMEEGAQFNLRLDGDMLRFKYPTRTEAIMERQLLIKALKES